MFRKLLIPIFLFPVKFYQLAIKPFLSGSCRHYPTCSHYAVEAINEWGPIKGWWLALKRIARCHPWGTSGIDPVPKKNNAHAHH